MRTAEKWNEIEGLINKWATNAKVEAKLHRDPEHQTHGRGFRNADNYLSRITLRSAAQTAA